MDSLNSSMNSSYGRNDSISGCGNALQLIRAVASDPQRNRSSQVTSNLAYCPQVPCMHAGSIRSNILMGSEMEEKRYRSVLEGCCLQQDIEVRSVVAADYSTICYYLELF